MTPLSSITPEGLLRGLQADLAPFVITSLAIIVLWLLARSLIGNLFTTKEFDQRVISKLQNILGYTTSIIYLLILVGFGISITSHAIDFAALSAL